MADEHIIHIKGFGNEFLIGFIDDNEIISISEDEDNINDVIDELSERNEFLNIYGPASERSPALICFNTSFLSIKVPHWEVFYNYYYFNISQYTKISNIFNYQVFCYY